MDVAACDSLWSCSTVVAEPEAGDSNGDEPEEAAGGDEPAGRFPAQVQGAEKIRRDRREREQGHGRGTSPVPRPGPRRSTNPSPSAREDDQERLPPGEAGADRVCFVGVEHTGGMSNVASTSS